MCIRDRPDSDSLEFEPSAAAAAAALDVKVARRLWYGGFAGLPWLWLVNYLHFRHTARLPSADPDLEKYVYRSLCGAILGAVLFVGWVVYVQLSWRTSSWLQSIMLVVPELSEEL